MPTYNAADDLPDCLKALRCQTWPSDRYEVIVADNSSTDHIRAVAAAHGARVVVEEQQGPAAARNAGATVAVGEILLFTDADCIPAPDWIERMIAPFADPAIAGVRGLYI